MHLFELWFSLDILVALHLTCIKHSLQPQKSDPVSQTLSLTRVTIYRKKVAKTAVDMEDIYSATEPASLVSDMGTLATQPARYIPPVCGVALAMLLSACPEMSSSSSPSCLFENVGFIIIQICEADRSGDDCHGKDSYYSSQEEGSCHTTQSHHCFIV